MYLLLLLLWIIFNGRITLEIILFGMVIVGCIYAFMCRFMNFSIKKDISYCKKLLWAVKYLLILFWEIIKANIQVMDIILSVKTENEPAIVKFRTTLKSKTARVILANSITMTPGTITAKLEDDLYEIHCLDKDLAIGIDSSVFVKELEKLERMK